MSNQIFHGKHFMKLSVLSLCLLISMVSSCAVSAKTEDKLSGDKAVKNEKISPISGETKNSLTKGRIKFAASSPADAIRIFYKNLREKQFREALMMTNLRAAVEGLSAAELEDLRPDFEPLANQVPADLQINGEIITGDKATVTVKMLNEETNILEDKVHSLERENGNWIYLMADAEAEMAAKKEGKNYFFELRLDVHHLEAQNMMERIAKAQMVYAIQNGGSYGDMKSLISQGLLPDDAQNAQSTGYRYNVLPSSDKKKYTATAEPAVYGKTGKLSYILEFIDNDQKTRLRFEDNKGAPLKTKKS